MSTSADRLRSLKTFEDLTGYLEDELGWELQGYDFDQLTFEYQPSELGLKDEDAVKVRRIHQLRPLEPGQPWGIFFVEFEKKKLPVVVLRRILSHLVIKKRADANRAKAAAWQPDDLLFISAFGEQTAAEREIAFAHFHQESGDLPTLRVLGWDGGDTPLKLDYVAATLKSKLHWPDDPTNHAAWREQWSRAFRHRIGHVIRTADALAEVLATLARGIRDAAQTMIQHETERGQLRRLHRAFQAALIHDLTEADFADTYAQTITYGLLTAAISRTEMSEGRHGTALIADNVADIVPVTNPFLKEMLQTFLKLGGRKGGIDFDELGIQDVVDLLRGGETDLPAILRDFGNKTRGEDPVIHFYEHFLNAYNKKLKVQRGVFYTPQPVVSYIVRSVHELLQTEFRLEDGLADITTWAEFVARQQSHNPQSTICIPEGVAPDSPFVQILDPATGTATFLVEVIEVIHRTLTDKWKRQGLNDAARCAAWNEYVPQHLLPRLHGYELMMAPYAIAHMKLPLKLKETGFKAWDKLGDNDRARIYLTNALEPASDVNPKLPEMFPALAHEAQAVNNIKRYKRFTVLIGNPPYSGVSANMAEATSALIEPYKFIDGNPLGERKHWLQDDYVKFLRLAQLAVENTGIGVIGYITNHGYLDNPTFRGMRQNLMLSFSDIRLLDLHGSVKKRDATTLSKRDENVFDIEQGVAVGVFLRGLISPGSTLVHHASLTGPRAEKYEWLTCHSLVTRTQLNPSSPYYFFVKREETHREEYEALIPVTSMFQIWSTGVQTSRDHLVVAFDRNELKRRLEEFVDPNRSDSDVRTEFFPSKVVANYKAGDTRQWALSDARKSLRADTQWDGLIQRCLYRPFDLRQMLYDRRMVDWPRPKVMRHMLAGKNMALLLPRQLAGEIFYHAFCTRNLAEMCVISSKTTEQNNLFPLYLYEEERSLALSAKKRVVGQMDRVPNFRAAFLMTLAGKLGLELCSRDEVPTGLTPEDIFHYSYAVFHSPGYRSRYAEFLKIEFPRLPLTSSLELFRALAQLGGKLVALHLVEFALKDEADAPAEWPRYQRLARFTGADPSIERFPAADKAWKDGRVAINTSSGFEGVPEEVWKFHIGGYQVCHKWLKDRKGRELTDEDIMHYCKIVTALNETIRLMRQIDEVINEHGGWPGAFAMAEPPQPEGKLPFA